MRERYAFPLASWQGVFGTFATSQGWLMPHQGVWFWAEFPQRRPYIKRARRQKR